ncbi:MAG: NAD(P)/FAD-dependent oxidoreductase [Betaproteobacteria bacterium]|nr:NAD(P)/FAD-dependent oxidoreductase [Betaproteobacteria bacterium]
MNRTALILGAGLGGVVAAETLRRLLPAGHRVVAVERAERYVFPPSLLWLMVGTRTAEQISRPCAVLSRRGIELVRGEVTAIRPRALEVAVNGQMLRGDALVIALGAEYAMEGIPGLAASGHCFYTLEGAQRAREALDAFAGGRIVVLTATPMYKCPAGPYEAALLVEDLLRRRGIRERAQIDFYAAEPGPMMTAGPEVSAALRAMIEARGISYHPEHQVQLADPESRTLQFANGAKVGYDLLLYVAPHRAPQAVREAGLTNEAGWIPVDRYTLETTHKNVFAIGDVTVIPLKIGRPLPKAGVFAHGQAETVARNIARAWTGAGASKRFDGEGACFIEVGSGRAGMGSGNFYAEPAPQVRLRAPSFLWHGAKVLYEKYWLFSRF